MSFSKVQFMDGIVSRLIFQKGLDYQKGNRVTITKDTVNAWNKREIRASVKSDMLFTYYSVFVLMDKDGKTILDCGCDCPEFKKYLEPCRHIVATILEISAKDGNPQISKGSPQIADSSSDGPEKENAGEDKTNAKANLSTAISEKVTSESQNASSQDNTEDAVEGLMQRYAKRSLMQSTSSTARDAILEPTLILDKDGAKLSFRIGKEHLYLVKNILQLIHNLRRGAEFQYGKKFDFIHRIENFSESSRPVAQFVLDQYSVRDDNAYYDYVLFGYESIREYENYRSAGLKYLSLTPHTLDEFMDIFIGKKLRVVENENNNENSELFQVRSGNPKFTISVQKINQSDFKIVLDKKFCLFKGVERIYIFCEGVVYCCDKAYTKTCTDFISTISYNGGSLIVGKESMKALVSTVLTEISPFFEIQSSDDLTPFQPVPLVTKIYLDMPQSQVVTADMKFCYGEEEHKAFQPKKISKSIDLKGELYAEAILRKYFPAPKNIENAENALKTQSTLKIQSDEGALYRLVSEGINEFSSFAEIYVTDAFRKIKVRSPVTAQIGVRTKSGLLEINFGLEGLDCSEMLEILRSYRKAKKYHRLRDGSFLSLESDSLANLSEMVDGLDLSSKEIREGKAIVPKYRSLYLDALLKQGESTRYERDAEFKRIVRGMKDVSDADFDVPKSLKPTLRNYQKTGYRWLRTLAVYGFGGILADDMGLGKTLEVLSVLLAQKLESKRHCVSLVVCPSSIVLNWKEEARRFTPELQVTAIAGDARERADLLQKAENEDLLITSYDSLKRDMEHYDHLTFEYEITDEAQYIKNYSTQNAKSVKAIKSHVRFALTGTPIENSLAELWSIFDFLMPGYLFAYSRFRNKLEAPIVRSNDASAEDRLKKLIQPFILRRLKKDVLKELPEKTESVLHAEMQEEQKKLYLANVALTKRMLEKEPAGKVRIQILAMLTRLRQICCDPSLVYENYKGGSAKLDLCMDLVQSCLDAGHKLLLFSQFTSMLKIIRERLDSMGIRYFELTGATRPSDRLSMVNKFNGDKTPVFLISLKAGGTGLNLTGADVVIHYDPWWNLSVQNQATDRAHRIGQKHNVQVYKLIVKDTLEEKILEMQRKKADLADRVIQKGGISLAKMSKEEILSLFQ